MHAQLNKAAPAGELLIFRFYGMIGADYFGWGKNCFIGKKQAMGTSFDYAYLERIGYLDAADFTRV